MALLALKRSRFHASRAPSLYVDGNDGSTQHHAKWCTLHSLRTAFLVLPFRNRSLGRQREIPNHACQRLHRILKQLARDFVLSVVFG